MGDGGYGSDAGVAVDYCGEWAYCVRAGAAIGCCPDAGLSRSTE